MFGKLVGGDDVLNALEKIPVKTGTDRPAKTVKITEVIMCVFRHVPQPLPTDQMLLPSYQDPFEDYKKRLAKKLAKRAEQNTPGAQKATETKKDEINWFGVKIGSEAAGLDLGGSNNDGVGRYLNMKRPLDAAVKAADDSKKKRKLGFGDFEGW